MDPELKPIKRSEQLTSLSKEHHEGLLFVWKLRQGLKNGTSYTTLRDFVGWFWSNDLGRHFLQEEVVLLPYLEPAHELAVRLRDEHARIRELVLQVSGNASEDSIEKLASLLNDHIRFEERIFFPYIEQLLSPQQLNSIQEALGVESGVCDNSWKNEFWARKSAGMY